MSEIKKHRANIIEIAGFALMTPFGSTVVNIFGYDLFKFGALFFLIYLSLALILFYCGTLCIIRSQEIIEGLQKNGSSG